MFKLYILAFVAFVCHTSAFNYENAHKCANGDMVATGDPTYTFECNGSEDCPDGSDEASCDNQIDSGYDNVYKCADGAMVAIQDPSYKFRCNGFEECPDGSDEKDCGNDAGQNPEPTPEVKITAPPQEVTDAPVGPSDACSCGCTPNEPVGDIAGIIGGTIAKPFSWPWQIWLTINLGGSSANTCGGSLIAENWVLTAGHCLKSDRPLSDYTVHAGMFKTWRAEQELKVESVHPYPGYPDWPKRKDPKNPYMGGLDIALIKLTSNAKFGDKVQKVCLPKEDAEQVATGQKLTVTGWGGVSTANEDTSEVLKQVSLEVKPVDKIGFCKTDTEICTPGPSSGAATYFGDSGGPLVKKRGANWFQHGVVSGFATVQVSSGGDVTMIKTAKYVRVSAYCDWISKTTEIEICK